MMLDTGISATAVILCRDEFDSEMPLMYMHQRHPALESFPGHWAFPGGKVDVEDATLEPSSTLGLDGEEPAVIAALCREVQEESGINLVQEARSGNLVNFAKLGTARSPADASLKVETHFFRVDLKHQPDTLFAEREVSAEAWQSVSDWYAQYRDGQLLVMPPTLVILEELSRNAAAVTVPALNFVPRIGADGQRRITCIESINGIRQYFVPSNTLPPAENTNCFAIGDDSEQRLIIDPSPKNEKHLKRLQEILNEEHFSHIFITHHHGDHNQFADRLAREYDVPMLMSADTHDRLSRRRGKKFFAEVDVQLVEDQQVLCQWLGQPVRAYAIPGHDEGHLGLAPDNKAWFIVGDLIQGIGTVVIAEPEGHMGRYFQSLEKVIDLAPQVIYPSHGVGMGTTFRLEETLRHRKMREARVLELSQQNAGESELLEDIYPDLHPGLKPLALCNIRSHQKKLREEGLLPA